MTRLPMHLATITLAALLALPLGRAAAQRVTKDAAVSPASDSTWYAVTIGGDTLAMELVVRARERVHGELRLLRPQPMSLMYTAWMRRDGTADSVHTVQERAGTTARATMQFAGDSAAFTAGPEGAGAPRTARFRAGAGAMPFLNLSSGVLDLIFRRARIVGGADVAVPLVAGPQAMPGRVRFVGADSAVLDLNVELRAAIGADGAFLGAVVPSQKVRFSRIARPASWGDPGAAAFDRFAAPPGAPYTATDVRIPAPGGVKLAGTLTLPPWASGVRPAPVVVTISGSGPQNRDSELVGISGYALFRQVADTLGRRGVGVLRLDDRGVGASGSGTSEPTSADLAEDVRAVIAWLRARAEVDAARIGLLGHSEGAMVAPMVAAADARVGAVALLAAPSRQGHEVSAHQRRLAIAANPAVPAAARDSAFAASQAQSDSLVRAGAAGAWSRFWWTYDPLPAARRLRMPVLVLHGATDTQVPVAHGEEIAAAVRGGGNTDVTLHTIPGVNHLFLADAVGHWAGYADLPSKVVPPAVMGIIADWFAGRLAPRADR